MKRIVFFILLLFLAKFSFGEEKNQYDWMNNYYLTTRFSPLDLSVFEKIDLKLSTKQIEVIKSEYDKYFPIMLGKARIIKDKEEELKKAVYESNDSTRIKNLVVEIAKLKTELTVIDINLLKTIQSILNKDQNEKFLKYLRQVLSDEGDQKSR